MSREQWAELVRESFPELVMADLRHPTWANISRFHGRIQAELATNRATTVWQRLRDEGALSVSLARFRRYLYAHLPEEVAPGGR